MRWSAVEGRGQLARAAQQHDVERRRRNAKERRALLAAGVGDKAQSQSAGASGADRIERSAKSPRLLVWLTLKRRHRHLGDRQFLEPRDAFHTLGRVHRVVAPLVKVYSDVGSLVAQSTQQG